MEVNKANGCLREDEECGPPNILFAEAKKSEKKQRRWSELPTGSTNLQSQFLSSSHFLTSLPRMPSIQQTGMWVLKCDFSLGPGDLGRVSPVPPCTEQERPHQDQEDGSDDEMLQEYNDQTQNDTWPLLKGIEKSHSAFVRRKNSFLSSTAFEPESFGADEAVCQINMFETKDPTLHLNLTRPNENYQQITDTGCRFSNHEGMSESTSRAAKSPEMYSSSSCSASSSSNCFSSELSVASIEFVCFWNTCSHREKNTDRLFHHILHSHLHRSTDFRSTRCLWRGCSRDGILKVFNSRHKLLVHVGIHCQKLKEPQALDEAKDQTLCEPQTEQTKSNSMSNSAMQNLLGLRRLFMFRKSGQSSRWTKQ